MPILNPNKCYTQQEQHSPITVPTNLTHDWHSEFSRLLSDQLKIDDQSKQKFIEDFNRHTGSASTFTYKDDLLNSLSLLYMRFKDSRTTDEQRQFIASRIAEDIESCTPGFSNRVNYILMYFDMPQNLDELIARARFNLVDRIASIIAAQNPQGVHVHNRVVNLARIAGFGVHPINEHDTYSNIGSRNLSDTQIINKLKTGFTHHFQLFALLNALRDEIEALIAPHGYQGRYAEGGAYGYGDLERFYECLNCFLPKLGDTLTVKDTTTEAVIDIDWQLVKQALLKRLIDESYVSLSNEERALLEEPLDNQNGIRSQETLTTLIPDGYELAQCLVFFSEWSMEQKAAFVHAYLSNKLPNEQKEGLAILHNDAPQLTAQLKKEPNLQVMYFTIAIAEKDIKAVRTYIERGENINEALLLLFSQAHKGDTLYWLHEHPHLLKKMTVAGMNTVINQGKYQGKTVAETLVSTKKGRQLLSENSRLQTLFSQTTMANSLSDALKKAKTERMTVSSQEGFFKKPSPLAIQLVQYIVYGDLKKSKALLQDNPTLLETLLTEKVTVIDYSRRKVKQKTAFQAALCAMDDELCAMLANYMTNEEMTRQYQEIFPDGHESDYQEQTPFNFSKIMQAISESQDEDVKKALSLELPNNTELWEKLEKFRADFTKCSSQEAVFNPQHLIKAFELYDSQFNNWSWNQRDLFWRQVVGFVQRFLPANIAMDFVQGLYNRVEEKEKAARSLKFRYGGGAMFPLDFDSFSGLGFEYACDGRGGMGFRAEGGAWCRRRCEFDFKPYVKQKQQSWESYTARGCQQPSASLLRNSVM